MLSLNEFTVNSDFSVDADGKLNIASGSAVFRKTGATMSRVFVKQRQTLSNVAQSNYYTVSGNVAVINNFTGGTMEITHLGSGTEFDLFFVPGANTFNSPTTVLFAGTTLKWPGGTVPTFGKTLGQKTHVRVRKFGSTYTAELLGIY